MRAIGKRLINVLTGLCILFAVVLVVLMITGNVSDWGVFLIRNFGMVLLAFVGIATTNYVLFGKATLWHKSDIGTDND